MSTDRCEHGNVVYDTMGEYRCWRCDPLTGPEISALFDRIDELERLVAQLADAAGLAFYPPEQP